MILYTSIILLIVLVNHETFCEEMSDENAMTFLKTYGYMKENESLDDMSKAVADYQMFNGIEPTGLLNGETKEMMMKPRCGMPDIQDDDNEAAIAKYTFLGRPWNKQDLTYSIIKYHEGLQNSAVDREMKDALNIWTKYTNLRFTRVNSRNADILISFERGNHNDGNPFRPGTTVLAHAYAPGNGIGGDAHFNSDVNWITNGYSNGINVYSVAAHEFGHALGLGHSDIRNALMYPTYHETDFRNRLHDDDIMGIQRIYEPKVRSTSVLCSTRKVDTIMKTPKGQILVFVGENFFQLPSTAYSTEPLKISANLPNLPNNIDATFTNLEKDIYFFKGSQVWKYRGQILYPNYPKAIAEEFPGIPDNIDTVFIWEQTRKLFFFKGNQLWGYRPNQEPHVESKYPINIASWGIPTPFDASVVYHGQIFIFKDTNYYKLNTNSYRVAQGYPKSIKEKWFQCA